MHICITSQLKTFAKKPSEYFDTEIMKKLEKIQYWVNVENERKNVFI